MLFRTIEFKMAIASMKRPIMRIFMTDRFNTETKKKKQEQSCNSMYLSSTLGITRHILHNCVHKVWKQMMKTENTSLKSNEINQLKERNVTFCRPIAKRHQTDTLDWEPWFQWRLQVKRTRKKIKRLEELPGYSLTLVNVTNTLIQPVGSNDFALKTGLTHLNG